MIVPQDSSRNRLQNIRKRKHRHCPDSSPSSDDAAHASSKRQKLCRPTVPPPSFWDGLSEVPLCASALRELDRRNKRRELGQKDTAAPLDSTRRRSRRLRTRRAATDDCSLFTDQFLRRCSATTLKGVRRLATHGGPDLTELRGFRAPRAAEHGMSSSQSSLGRRKRGSQSPVKRDSSNTTTTRSTGPYDRAFQQHLIDHNILPDGYEYPDGRLPPEPENIDEITAALAQPRPSLSPSQFSKDDFRKFKRADTHATKESQVMSKVIPIIEGDIGDTKCAASDVLFTNLDHLTDGTLVPAKPDLYYGARPEQLDRRVRKDLDGHIVPSTQHDLPVVPNWFLEAKGPDGSLSVASRQATYVAANGARGIHSLQSYKAPEQEYDNNAYTLTSIYHGGQLKMYASHPIQPSTPGGAPGYVMTQIDTWSLTGNSEAFRKGAAAYRNGRDWAKQQRDEAIERANKVAMDEVDDLGLSFASVASAANTEPTSQDTITNHESNRTPSLYDSDTSADLADVVPLGKRYRGFGEASSASGASQSGSRVEAGPSGSPLKRPAADLDTLGDGEQPERPGEPDPAPYKLE